jgi:hypothetical protein
MVSDVKCKILTQKELNQTSQKKSDVFRVDLTYAVLHIMREFLSVYMSVTFDLYQRHTELLEHKWSQTPLRGKQISAINTYLLCTDTGFQTCTYRPCHMQNVIILCGWTSVRPSVQQIKSSSRETEWKFNLLSFQRKGIFPRLANLLAFLTGRIEGTKAYDTCLFIQLL